MCADSGIAAEQREVSIVDGAVTLPGRLAVPERAAGIVVFAHGSGSGRLSPRNLEVAAALERAGLATLLFDLLTEDEARNRERVFDIPLLGARLIAATAWVERQQELSALATGYFGASTGAAAALVAAANIGEGVSAVVSRGGRPDLAGARLELVTAPTLLIVGGEDPLVLELNRAAQARLRCINELVVIPGATHLFEEPGALEAAAAHATAWFLRHLAGREQ